MCDECAGAGEWKEMVDGKEESVKKDGEVDVLLMEKDGAGAATRVLAIAEMKSGAYDLASGEQQHEQCVRPRCNASYLQRPKRHNSPQIHRRRSNAAVHRQVLGVLRSPRRANKLQCPIRHASVPRYSHT